MKTPQEIEQMLMALPDVVRAYPYGNSIAVYKLHNTEGIMFALIDEQSSPLRVSLRCDTQLAQLLRDKYESVLPGFNLNKNQWNTVLMTGQVPEDELQDLIRHSYEIATQSATD